MNYEGFIGSKEIMSRPVLNQAGGIKEPFVQNQRSKVFFLWEISVSNHYLS